MNPAQSVVGGVLYSGSRGIKKAIKTHHAVMRGTAAPRTDGN